MKNVGRFHCTEIQSVIMNPNTFIFYFESRDRTGITISSDNPELKALIDAGKDYNIEISEVNQSYHEK